MSAQTLHRDRVICLRGDNAFGDRQCAVIRQDQRAGGVQPVSKVRTATGLAEGEAGRATGAAAGMT